MTQKLSASSLPLTALFGEVFGSLEKATAARFQQLKQQLEEMKGSFKTQTDLVKELSSTVAQKTAASVALKSENGRHLETISALQGEIKSLRGNAAAL